MSKYQGRAPADANRALLDRRVICDLLGFDADIYHAVRRLAAKWCAEPSVHGGKSRPACSLTRSACALDRGRSFLQGFVKRKRNGTEYPLFQSGSSRGVQVPVVFVIYRSAEGFEARGEFFFGVPDEVVNDRLFGAAEVLHVPLVDTR